MTFSYKTIKIKKFNNLDGTSYYDVDLNANKDLEIVDGVDAVAQTVRNAILLWKGEYQYDVNQGVRWDLILGKPVNRGELDGILEAAILSVQHVTRVLSINYEINNRKRTAKVSIEYLNEDNTEEFISVNI